MDLALIVIASFACFRLQELVTVDDGPGDVLKKMRAALGAYRLGEDGQPKTSLGRGMLCPYCVGIWMALVLALMIFPIEPLTLVYWFAIAGGAAVIQTIGGRI